MVLRPNKLAQVTRVMSVIKAPASKAQTLAKYSKDFTQRSLIQRKARHCIPQGHRSGLL